MRGGPQNIHNMCCCLEVVLVALQLRTAIHDNRREPRALEEYVTMCVVNVIATFFSAHSLPLTVSVNTWSVYWCVSNSSISLK